ncbi:hypothetical protein [Bacillus cereus]|uniref:hypothetical protein n=1 Tax=Bacillus cereus TaxID=1396 RepID=UPI00397F2717
MGGKSIENLEKNRECVINLPSSMQWEQVEKIAPYTGMENILVYKQEMGYTYQNDKSTIAGFTAFDSQFVKSQRIKECLLQIEARVKNIRIPEYVIEAVRWIISH